MEGMLLFGSLLRSNIIKVPHHGGRLGNIAVAREFFKEVDSLSAIISTTEDYLREEILELFEESGTKVYKTPETGAIIAKEAEKGFEIHGFTKQPE
jgi:beta-lactamase superfamily II metal-dependent hydrolase